VPPTNPSRCAPRAPAGAALSPSLYWNQTSRRIADESTLVAWRAYMAAVYRRLLRDWLPAEGDGPRLKTDLFEEAVSRSRPFDDLGRSAVGIDVSYAVARRAHRRLGPRASCVVADLRALPFADRSVAHILSGSSLDHFAERADLRTGLAELARVLSIGGTLVLTLDNPHNPVVRLRNLLPYRLLEAARLVPYYVGATLGRAEAEGELRRVGLRVAETRAVAHAPRAAAIWLERLLERFGGGGAWLAAAWGLTETLARWPSRDLTGYYLAFRVERAAAGSHTAPGAISRAEPEVGRPDLELPARRTA
jgi:SAM-dependent methyltransferase